MTAYTLVSAYLILVALAATTARAADPPKGPVVAAEITATRNCETQLGQPRSAARSPWKHHSRGYWAAELNRWKTRHARCLATLHERARQWNWSSWLPSNWLAVARCESSVDWYFTGRSTDGYFVSAFAISVQEYDADARLMGVRPWYVKGKGTPSPWEQWRAALGHFKRFGDGWTGRCRGLVYR